MGQFTNGVIVGLGISLLFAPKQGKEMHTLLMQSFQTLRGNPPENEALQQQVQQMAGRVQAAQQLASRAADMGSAVQSDLSNVAQQAGTNIPSPTSSTNTSAQPNQTRKSPL